MARFKIGNIFKSGKKIAINRQRIEVDGDLVAGVDMTHDIEIRVLEGTIEQLTCDKSVTCGPVSGSVTAGGSVNADNVEGSITAQGSVKCDNVGANVSAGGSVNCNDVEGDVRAGGAVTMRR